MSRSERSDDDGSISNRDVLKEVGKMTISGVKWYMRAVVVAAVVAGILGAVLILAAFAGSEFGPYVSQFVLAVVRGEPVGVIPPIVITIVDIIIKIVGLAMWVLIGIAIWKKAEERAKNRSEDFP